MIAIDTNVIVQFITHDDPGQWPIAERLLSREQVFVSISVLLETGWVLKKAYGFDKTSVVLALRSLLGLANVRVEEPVRVPDLLDWAGRGLDFADAMHLAAAAECEAFVTFDRDFARRAAALDAVPVRAP